MSTTYKIISNPDSVIIEQYKDATRVQFEPFKKGELKARVSPNDVRISHREGYMVLGADHIRIPFASLTVDGATTNAEKEAKFADPTFLITEGASGGGAPLENWNGDEIKIGTIVDETGATVDYYQRGWVVQGNGTAMITLESPYPADIKRVYSSQFSRAQGSPFTFYQDVPSTVGNPIISAEDSLIAIQWLDGSNPGANDWRYYLQIKYTKN